LDRVIASRARRQHGVISTSQLAALGVTQRAVSHRPRVNETPEGKEVDFLVEHRRLIVETDSWRFHRTRHAFENDRARDTLHLTRGYRTLRVTHRALKTDPTSVAATIKTVLTA
jgi:very-short-patch-repair endonuclease